MFKKKKKRRGIILSKTTTPQLGIGAPAGASISGRREGRHVQGRHSRRTRAWAGLEGDIVELMWVEKREHRPGGRNTDSMV